MSRLVSILFFALALIVHPEGRSDPSGIPEADAEAIRALIESQLAAFAADDAQTAFSFASENIQKTFGTAEHFLAMVRASYPVVYHPASVNFLDPERVDDVIVQVVEMADEDDRLWLAIYRMQRQPGGSWRIDGCVLKSVEGTRS